MGRKATCPRCGASFFSPRRRKATVPVGEIGGAGSARPSALCPQCRSQLFAEHLLGQTVDRTERTSRVAFRRRDPLRSVRDDARLGTTVYKSQCTICNQGCDALVHVKDGAVKRVEGDTSSPVTKGTLCSKGLSSRHILYHPDRLLYPLKRAGARGDGKWSRITWDEAFGTIAERLRSIEARYGSESIVLATGTNRGWVRYFSRFAAAYGKQTIGPGIAQCWYPRMIGQWLVLGSHPMESPHYEATRCMIVWGCNPTNTWPAKGVGMMEARSRGARLIVIDPMLSEAASRADLWLQLRPGTDAALALGMLHTVITEGLFDRAFVERWCMGFEDLERRVADYPPERVEAITWVPAAMIREAARLYASARPASITQCLSIDQNADTISTARSIAMLAAITGNVDVPGGNVISMLTKHVPGRQGETSWLTEEDHDKRLGGARYPLLSGAACPMAPSAHNHAVWNAVLTGKPYPVKAIYCHGSNMLRSYANTPMVAGALARLDFLVVADLFPTETAQRADIVLPAASWMERDWVIQNEQSSPDHFHLQQKTVRRGECRSDAEIMNELARRLGFGDRMFPTEEAFFDYVLAPAGQTFKEFKEQGGLTIPMAFRKYEARGFNTPSGKVESAVRGSNASDSIPCPPSVSRTKAR